MADPEDPEAMADRAATADLEDPEGMAGPEVLEAPEGMAATAVRVAFPAVMEVSVFPGKPVSAAAVPAGLAA